MKKILLIFVLLLFTSCSINKNEELNNKVSKLEKENQELNTNLKKFKENKYLLNWLINIKWSNPENFNYWPCIYLHWDDWKIRNWKDFSDEKINKLNKLFSKSPIIKLDYTKNPNNISDEIYIWPLCNCQQYSKAEQLIWELQLNFTYKLFHWLDWFGSCIDLNKLYK